MLKERLGVVTAVCSSPRHGFPTYPQDEVYIGPLGIPGDAHSGPYRKSFTRPGTDKKNDRPISIVADEVRQEVNQQLGLDMQPGDFNEQIVVVGLGDLGYLEEGSILTFEDGPTLRVVDHAYPCKMLEEYNQAPGIIDLLLIPSEKKEKKAYSKRGILCEVLEPGNLQPGSSLKVIYQSED